MVAERALEACGIIVDRNRVPGDRHGALVTGGVRLGASSLVLRGIGAGGLPACAELVDRVLRAVRPQGDREDELSPCVATGARDAVAALCVRFAIPGYGA